MDGADHLGQPVRIAVATSGDAADWAEMRGALWPGGGDGGTHADNQASHKMHNALGFEETQRVVFFRKILE